MRPHPVPRYTQQANRGTPLALTGVIAYTASLQTDVFVRYRRAV